MIYSWANKTSWRQKKKKEKKKSSNCAYLLQKKKGKNTAGEGGTAGIYWRGNVMAARAAGSWCPALGSGLSASGCCHGHSVQWCSGHGQPPWELPACCSASSQGVCFLVGVWQLSAAVVPSGRFPRCLGDRVRTLRAQLMDLKVDFLW